MINALGDSIRASANGNSSLCWIRQHLGGNLDRGSGHLSYLLNFWATFADQWATLWSWYYKPEGDGRSGYSCGRNQVCQVLKNLRKKMLVIITIFVEFTWNQSISSISELPFWLLFIYLFSGNMNFIGYPRLFSCKYFLIWILNSAQEIVFSLCKCFPSL